MSVPPDMSAAGPSRGAKAPPGGSDPAQRLSVGAPLSAAGPSQGVKAPSGAATQRSGGAWGLH